MAERADGGDAPLRGHGPDRHAAGDPLLPARRDPAVRAPAAALRQGGGAGTRRSLLRRRRPAPAACRPDPGRDASHLRSIAAGPPPSRRTRRTPPGSGHGLFVQSSWRDRGAPPPSPAAVERAWMFAGLTRYVREAIRTWRATPLTAGGPSGRFVRVPGPPEPAAPSRDDHRRPPGPGISQESVEMSQVQAEAKPLVSRATGARMAATDAADPPVRRTGGDAVPEGGDRRLLPPVQRTGAGGRRFDRRAPRGRLRHHRLPRPRPCPGPRDVDPRRAWPSCSARRRAAPGARAARCTSSTPRRTSSGGHAIVGSHIPLAAGVAFAIKYRGEDRVCICYFGDGAMNQGAFHEALQHGRPLEAAGHLRRREQPCMRWGPRSDRSSAVLDLTVRGGTAYGMPGVSINGNDIELMAATTREAADRARAGEGPDVHRGQDLPLQGATRSATRQVPDQGRARRGHKTRPDRRLPERAQGARLDRRRGHRAAPRRGQGRGRGEHRVRRGEPAEPPLDALYEDITVAPYIPQE